MKEPFKQKWDRKKWFILGACTPVIYMFLKMLFERY